MFAKHQFRNHGMEEDYYSNGYYGGYPPSPGYRPNFAGQPSPRFHGHMNMYPPSPYGGFQYEHAYGERTQGRSGTPRRLPRSATSDKESRGAGGKLEKTLGADLDTCEEQERSCVGTPPLDEDFPSLNGESEAKDEKSDKCKPPAGVWDKNSLEKITNHSKTNENGAREVKHNTNIYKALVPIKGKVGVTRVGGVSSSSSSSSNGGKENNSKLGSSSSSSGINKDVNSNTPPAHNIVSTTPVRNNKERSSVGGGCGVGESVSAPLDILNTRTVTQPRTLADKKSDFLKALKQENDLNNSNTNGKCLENGVDDIMQSELINGVDDLELTRSTNGRVERTTSDDCGSGGSGAVLSSSLEAEQRLLREMGWSEDDEETPITEEEMREIQQLQTQIKQQLKEQKNGFNKKTLPMTWSPQHVSSAPVSASSHLPLPTTTTTTTTTTSVVDACLYCSDSDSDSS